jgi:hypothetical protein
MEIKCNEFMVCIKYFLTFAKPLCNTILYFFPVGSVCQGPNMQRIPASLRDRFGSFFRNELVIFV